eukprot:GHVN01007480.1.p1 GENE.GHVN01007480.1~~GHVN01007480.1.p1  ORF type:complete len:354 (+),score=38.17 GHVN01007480.1:62-1063(+)
MEKSDSTPTPIWLDCDPGHDDACAMLLAVYNPGVMLIGISTSAGNHNLEKTTKNALDVLSLCAAPSNIQVAAGMSGPFVQPPTICQEIHGDSGLEFHDPSLRSILEGLRKQSGLEREAVEENGILFMRKSIVNHPKHVTVVVTGPLTNVAALISVFPEVKFHIQRIVFMGGAIGLGNIMPAAEFNILVDPEALKIVLQSGIPIVQIPLEVTHTAEVTPKVIDRFPKTKFGELITSMLLYFKETCFTAYQMKDPALHDPLAVLYVIDPNLFHTAFLNVEVECGSSLTCGRTVVDFHKRTGRPPNATVALSVDVDSFWDIFVEAVLHADKSSPVN